MNIESATADMPLVSVVIPSYNHGAYIRETIQSVCDQTWPSIEIIVVDDGSTDGSSELLDKMNISALKVYHQENQGTAVTLNRGVKLARGEYISILNSDDRYHPRRIETLIKALKGLDNEASLAFSRVDLINNAGEPVIEGAAFEWLNAAYDRVTPETFLPLAVLRDNFTCTSSNFFFSRSLFDKIGGFHDFRYVNDFDFLMRAMGAGEFVYLDETLLSYRIHDLNTLNERFGEKEEDYLFEWSQVVAGSLENVLDYSRISWDDLTEALGGGDAMQMAAVFISILAHKKFGPGFGSDSNACSLVSRKISDAIEFRAFVDKLKTWNDRLKEDMETYASDNQKLSDENTKLFGLIEEKESLIQKYQADTRSYIDNIASLNGFIKEHDKKINEKVQRIQNLSDENTKLFGLIEEKESLIQNYQVDARSYLDNIALLNDFIKERDKKIRILKNSEKIAKQEIQSHIKEKDAIWEARTYFAGELEKVLKSKRFQFVEHLAGIKAWQQPSYHIKELVKLFAPQAIKNKIRRYRDNALNLGNKLRFINEKKEKIQKKITSPLKIGAVRYKGPLISIICPCYNYGKYLDRMLASLEAQTWQDFELIIVDDGSTDPYTIARIDELMKGNTPERIVVRQKNKGVIAARNHAVSLASGKYIFPLDPDDTIDKTFLEKICFFLEHCSSSTFAYTWTYSMGKETFIWETKPTKPFGVLEENRCGIAVFSKKAFHATGGYNQVMAGGYEDWELYVNLVRLGYIGKVIPEPLYHYDVRVGARNHHAEKQHNTLKKKINKLHRSSIIKMKKKIRKESARRYEVINGSINLTGKPFCFDQRPKWLNLTGISFDPAILFSDLLLYSELYPEPILVTVANTWQSFFNLNFRPNLYVYHPENYHPDHNPQPFMAWLKEQHDPEPIKPERIRSIHLKKSEKAERISILYVGPWLITGGADTMTVDWFRQLASPEFRLYFAATLPKDNIWINKIRGYSQGIYELPLLGYDNPKDIEKFLIDFISKNQIDILHVMNSPPVYEVLPRIRKAHPDLKIVAQFHCFDYLSDGTKVGYSVDVPQRLDQIIDRYNVESLSHQREIQELYPYIPDEKFECIYGCIDASAFNHRTVVPDEKIFENRKPGCLNLLFIGRLDFQKQPLVMMKVAHGLKDAGVDFYLHVVGDGSLDSQKREVLVYCKEHGLEDVVRFYGNQPLASMQSWYMVGDVLLLTSMWEGIPIVLYQAMSMGKTCVAPDVGGIKELIGEDCGVVIKNRTDINAYVKALSRLASRPELCTEIGSKARKKIVSQFDMKAMKKKYKTFYKNLI